MGGEWRETSLAELGPIVTGKTPSTRDDGFFGGTIPFITPSDMDGRRIIARTGRYLTEAGAASVKNAQIPEGTVIVSCIGSDMGKAAIAAHRSVTNQQINSIVVEPPNSSAFVYYDLSTRKAEIRGAAGGSAQPILNKTAFGRLPIVLPSPYEQRAIAHILGTLDDKIELNRRTNETLEAMARALFKSWFVDFDPVRAKAQGQTPSGMDTTAAALFPSELQDSELGEIPKGWRVVNIEQVADVRGGKQLPTEQRGEQGRYAVFGANGVMGHCESATHEGFVIAFGRVGAYCGSIHWAYEGAWINNNASAVVPKSFDEFVLQSMLGIDFPSMRTGSAQPFIPNSALAAAPLLSAPDEVLAAFCGQVRPLRIKQVSAQKESDSLARLRDALLPRLLSGELSVAQVEHAVEATA